MSVFVLAFAALILSTAVLFAMLVTILIPGGQWHCAAYQN
jgi:hypothetical protein